MPQPEIPSCAPSCEERKFGGSGVRDRPFRLIRLGRIFVLGRATAILVGLFHAFFGQFRRELRLVVGPEGRNRMAAKLRTLVPTGELFVARWHFGRRMVGGTGQCLEGFCAVRLGGLGAAILFGQVQRALPQKLVRRGANAHSLSFDSSSWCVFDNDCPRTLFIPTPSDPGRWDANPMKEML